MSDELFPPESVTMDSPRIAWMKRHGITVVCHDWTGTDFENTAEPRWQAFSSNAFRRQGPSFRHPVIWANEGDRCDTEDEAVVALAQEMGLKLWNEEGAS